MKRVVGILLIVSILVSICLGRYQTTLYNIWLALGFQADQMTNTIVWNLRIARIITVCFCGAALALSGYVFQTVFKNPLASGDIIGTGSGCSLGAAISILCGFGIYQTQVLSFLGGICVVGCVLCLSKQIKTKQILNLVLAGMILQALTTSCLMVLKIIADPQQQLASIEYWLMGGFSNITISQSVCTIGVISVTTIILYVLRWQIQQLEYGEEAKALGVPVTMIRMVALLCSTLLVSSVISIAGLVSWVGLLIPHMVRYVYRSSFSNNFSLTLLVGALFLLLCDTIARSISTMELPISVLTSFFGAIALLVLVRKGKIHV